MYTTAVFLYTQRQIVVLLSGYSPRRYMPVYAKPLTLHRNVDNQIQFQFLNQEQKPVDITGKQITCRIINYEGNVILLQKSLTLQLPATGIAAIEVSAAELVPIDPQKCFYSLEIPVGAFNYPVFVDQNAGGRGDMDIVNSILPNFVPSIEVSIPTGQAFPNNNPNQNSQPDVTYYSSVIESSDSPILTFQVKLSEYYGNVDIEGSTTVSGGWYPITSNTYNDTTDTIGYTINGFHPFVRIGFTSNAGAITNILSR